MLNWLKYAPFKWRQSNEPCSPRGPQFSSAHQLKFSLAGTEVQLKLPRHRSGYRSQEQVKPKLAVLDISYDSTRYYNQRVMQDNLWRQCLIASRSWGFWGPWFTGAKGEVTFAAEVIVPDQIDSAVSFFHPSVFESMVADFLTARYARHIGSCGALYEGPVEWQPLDIEGFFAASFYVLANHSGSGNTRMLLLPIGDYQLLKITFLIDQHCAGPQQEKDKKVNRSSMEQLVQDIIDSIEVSLSPEAKAQQKSALKGCDNPALSAEFPPLKWTTDEQDAKRAEEQRLFKQLADAQKAG